MSRAKTKTRKRTTKTRDPRGGRGENPLIDRALRARWNEALGRLRASKASETTSWDEQYEALGDILESDPPYYLAGGYKNARTFLASELPGVNERTARRYIRVARYFDPADEAEHGTTKLDVLLDYLEAAGGIPLAPAKIHLGRQKVKVARGKVTRHVPFADVSVDELRAATRKAKGAGAEHKASPTVKAVRAALVAAKLGEVSVGIRHNELSFGAVPVGKLAAFGRAVAKADV